MAFFQSTFMIWQIIALKKSSYETTSLDFNEKKAV